MERVDVVIVGGGVSGLASAGAAARGLSTCVLERHPSGLEASTHNSGVIHAGIYYPAGSLKDGCAWKAGACCMPSAPSMGSALPLRQVDRRRRLRIGAIEALFDRGIDNGVERLELDRQFIAREPAIRAVRGCCHRKQASSMRMRSSRRAAQRRARARSCCPARLVGVISRATGFRSGQRETILARTIVNAGGVRRDLSPAWRRLFTIFPPRRVCGTVRWPPIP
jgi:L-2-hydroxyglutarate oxidase LhgO